jgi:hypothetical protein
MNALYLITPIALVGVLAYSILMNRRMRTRVETVGAEQVMTDEYGTSFRLEPGELLRHLWMGQLYIGPAIPELHDTLGDKAGRVATQAAVALTGGKLRYLAVQVHVALTTRGRLLVARSGGEGPDDIEVSPHSEWQPGVPGIYFAPDLALDLGPPPSFDNGYRGPIGFVMFGREPGARLPVWLPADGCRAIASWRGTLD